MAEIPEDIRKAAEAVAHSLSSLVYGDGQYGFGIDEAAEIIAAALLAERERCEQAEVDEWEDIKQIALENMFMTDKQALNLPAEELAELRRQTRD